MVPVGRLEQEERTEGKILGTKMLPNSRLYEMEIFLSSSENKKQLEN